MSISVFLSYPKPCFEKQEQFVMWIRAHLEQRGFNPRTLGVNEYDMDAPLKAIRRLMLESNGLLTIAFRNRGPEPVWWMHGRLLAACIPDAGRLGLLRA